MLRALSLTQPWASLMAFDAKCYETRDWSTAARGEVAIVASKGFPKECRELCHGGPYREVLAAHGIHVVSRKTTGPTQLPLGVVVALVDIVDCIATTPEGSERRLSRAPTIKPAEHEIDFGNYSPNRYAFVTTNLRRLSDPVPVERLERDKATGQMVAKPGGALGFYALSPACEALVRERTEEEEGR